jgi:minor capsid protein L2
MTSLKRRKRDTVDNLYRQCQLGADCPPDVRNKVEGTTLADKLLQAFGSIIFLGGLGIGSGSGSGAVTAGRAIPDLAPDATPIRPTRPLRPSSGPNTTRPFSVPIDRIGVPGAGGRPVTIDATSSSIVPLTEAVPDTVITLGDPTIGVTTDIAVDVNPIELEPINQGPDTPAIINVTPTEPPPVRILYSDTTTYAPPETVQIAFTDPNLNVFVDPASTGQHIGLEEIELDTIGGPSTFEIEESAPRTSTPLERLGQVYNRARQYYNRRVQQVPTRNIDFLGQPSRAVLFGFENPAFLDDVTLEFEQDLREVAAAPDEDFRDVRQLHRPTFSITDEGLIRLSRLGSRATMQTRSGRVFGSDAHFYYDVSEIPEAGEIEMQDLVTPGVPYTIVDPQAESSFVNALADVTLFTEDQLVDFYTESFDNAQLILEGQTEAEERYTFPIPISTTAIKPFVVDIGNGIFYSSPTNISTNNYSPKFPFIPVSPGVTVNMYSDDYYLDPSLLKRKRKRSDDF